MFIALINFSYILRCVRYRIRSRRNQKAKSLRYISVVVIIVERMVWFIHKKICTHERDTCRRNRNFGGAAGEASQKKHRGVSWSRPRSVSRRSDGRASKRTNGREGEKDRSPDIRPKDHDDGSTCPIQDAVLLLGALHPRNLASSNPTSFSSQGYSTGDEASSL